MLTENLAASGLPDTGSGNVDYRSVVGVLRSRLSRLNHRARSTYVTSQAERLETLASLG